MISVFDMFSIGIGPSSSHTVGPMRAGIEFCQSLKDSGFYSQTDEVRVELYGSLGQTGKGHGTGKAVILGLEGNSPEGVDVASIDAMLLAVDQQQQLNLGGEKLVAFPRQGAIVFHRRKTLPLHANGMTFFALSGGEVIFSETYYS